MRVVKIPGHSASRGGDECTAILQVRLIGVEAGGEGVNTTKHAATLTKGTPGVLHGSFSYLLQDSEGQVIDPHSISAGCDSSPLPPSLCVCSRLQ